MGSHSCPITFTDPTVTHALATDDDTGLVRMSIVVRKGCVPGNTFDNLAKHCHQYVMESLGPSNFCAEHKLKPQQVTTVTWGGEETQQFRTMALIKTACADKAYFRSGVGGVFLRTFGRDDTTVAVLLPAKATLAQALASHRALPKDVGLGLVPTDKGFAIRCRPGHQGTVALAAKPEDAKAYGEPSAI